VGLTKGEIKGEGLSWNAEENLKLVCRGGNWEETRDVDQGKKVNKTRTPLKH